MRNGRTDAGSPQRDWRESLCACATYKGQIVVVAVKPRQDPYRDSAGTFVGGSPVYKLRALVKNEKTCMDMKTDPVLEEVRSSPSAALSSLSFLQPEAGYVSLTHKPLPLPLPAVEDSEAKFGNRLSVIPPTLLHSDSVFSFLSPFVLGNSQSLCSSPL